MQSNKLLFEWRQKIRIFHICHAKLSAFNYRLGRIIGLTATILSAIVATTVFTALTRSENTILLILAGIISIIAVIFSASHDFLKLPELALRHSQAVNLYGKLRRELEIDLNQMDDNEVTKEVLNKISNEWSELDKKVPPVPNRLYQKIKKEVKKEELSIGSK